MREKASIYISGAGGDICCVGGLGGGYECGNLMVLTCMRASHYLCVFFLGASSLLECVLYVSLLLYIGVWHSVPSAVRVASPFFPANQVIFHCTSVYYVSSVHLLLQHLSL